MLDKLTSTQTSCFFAVVFFFSIQISYAVLVFQQFRILDVLFISSIFLLLLTSLTILMIISQPKVSVSKEKGNHIAPAIFLTLLLVLLANSTSDQFLKYYPTFPMLQADIGRGWHQDSAYHVSIIQSILRTGFPSISQHEDPLIIYHVLSHYIDATMLGLTSLEPWDSYGLLFHLKETLVLSLLLVFFAVAAENLKPLLLFSLVILFLPAVIGSWHLIGSQGEWFATVLTIAISPVIFGIISDRIPISPINLGLLLIAIPLIAMAKVSAGFCVALILSISLILIKPKSASIYFVIFSWALFFVTYSSFFAVAETRSQSTLWLVKYILAGADGFSKTAFSLIMISFLISYLSGRRKNQIVFASGILSLLILIIVFLIHDKLLRPDLNAFLRGFNLFFLLLVIQSVCSLFLDKVSIPDTKEIGTKFIAFICVFLLAGALILPRVNLWNPNLNFVARLALLHPNEAVLPANLGYKETSILSVNRFSEHSVFDFHSDQPFSHLRRSVREVLAFNNLTESDVLLFIPREVYTGEFRRLFDPDSKLSFSYGLVTSAIIGIPLLHGIEAIRGRYGLSDYEPSAEWTSLEEFFRDDVCRFGKSVLVVTVIDPAKIDFYPC
ncbi:hypothetical protein AB2B41_12170 [Marimonas sp. MJW-29]|uniref:Glycosyltransferase RgtA/B/C/D-like domain-containing protein n=1 Tax=Sulfitobacter sediminis TaxID=3234186 RepID=A0ABV3RN24_9RHOB